ncbi:MAG: COX15/CtaA family protein [Acidobacteriaceae bacterium]
MRHDQSTSRRAERIETKSPRVGVRASITERALAPYAWGVLGFMVLVVLWGAIVRTTGSGAGCGNHWPLCNGDFVPHHPRLATIIEFTHRSMTGFLTTFVALLAAWIFWKRPRGDRARRGAIWVIVFLISEALLGAVLVKGGYVEANASNARVAMQCVHFTNTMLLLAALALTAWWLEHPARNREATVAPRALAVAAILLTLAVGATGAVAALADTLYPSPSLRAGLAQDFASTAPLIVRMRWVHPAASVLAFGCVALLCWRARSRMAAVVAGLLALQFVLGIGDVLLLAPQWMQVLHLLGADLFWIALVILAAGGFRLREQA